MRTGKDILKQPRKSSADSQQMIFWELLSSQALTVRASRAEKLGAAATVATRAVAAARTLKETILIDVKKRS